MSLPLFSSYSVNPDLYAYALTSAYRSGWRVLEPNIALKDDPDWFEKALRDPVIGQAVDESRRKIAGRLWKVLPFSDRINDKAAAKIMSEAFRHISEFTEARYIAAKARFTSRSYQYIEGERRMIELGDAPPLEWWIPTKLVEIDSRRFRYAPVKTTLPDGRVTTGLKEELWSWDRARWEELQNPECLLKVVYSDEESRLGYGRGLGEAFHSYLWIKGIVLRQGLQGLTRWAQGRIHVKIDGLRKASHDRDNDTIAADWLALYKKVASENVVVHDARDQVEVLETTGTGHQIVEFFLKYLDEGMIRLINGSVLPNGAGSETGSNARAQTESDNSESIMQFDREKIDENITEDVGGLFWRLNRQNFYACGLGDARCGRFETMQAKRQNRELAANVAKTLLDSGVPLKKADVYEQTGFEPPADDDEVFEGRPAPMPGEFGIGTGFGGGGDDQDPEANGDEGAGGQGGRPSFRHRGRGQRNGRR